MFEENHLGVSYLTKHVTFKKCNFYLSTAFQTSWMGPVHEYLFSGARIEYFTLLSIENIFPT